MCAQTQRGRVAGGGDQAGAPQEGGLQHRRELPQWDSAEGKISFLVNYFVDEEKFRIGRMGATHP